MDGTGRAKRHFRLWRSDLEHIEIEEIEVIYGKSITITSIL